MIHLHTLGDTMIKVGEKEIRPTSPLVFAALLYLAVERGRRVPRAALQELLFPNSDERSGAHSLRQLLYKLRQLGAPISVDSNTVTIAVGNVTDDADDTVNSSIEDDVVLSRVAKGLLPGYHTHVSHVLEQWLEERRSLFTTSTCRRLVDQVRKHRDVLDWPAVERAARAIIAVDPLNEEANLALAEAFAACGSKARAMDVLDRFASEVGRHEIQLPLNLLRRRVSEMPTERAANYRASPFVGRESEVQLLQQHLRRARRGTPSLLLLVGEAGIGKTRLLEEMTSMAVLDGFNVQLVRCTPHFSSRPLSVFIEIVASLLSSRGALGVSPESLKHLRLLTTDEHQTDRPNDIRDDALRSNQLLAALRDLISAVSSEKPLLLAIEDAHWIDSDSQAELLALTSDAIESNVFIICTTRHFELKRVSSESDNLVVHRLRPLGESSMTSLAVQLLDDDLRLDPSNEVIRWLVTTAAGNPFFLEQLCSHYSQTRQAFTVPQDLRATTVQRIERLGTDCRKILEIIALLGRHCTLEILRTICDYSDSKFLTLIRELEDNGFIRESGPSVTVMHDLLGEATLGLVSPLTRKTLHGIVARCLEQQLDVNRDASLVWDCADHWRQSGDT